MKQTFEQLVEKLKAQFPDADAPAVENGDQAVFVAPEKTAEVARFLKDTPGLEFDYLMNVSAFDAKDHIELTYHFHSYTHRHTLVVKAKAVRIGGSVASLSSLYGAANFQEREVFDHFGVKFTGHPDLRRLLLPDDWVGYPLLKDYVEQEDYNGIATTRPSML